MPKINQFTTEGKTSAEIWDEIVAAGAYVKLPFEAVGFKHTKKLPKGIKFKDRKGKDFKPKKVNSI